MTIVARLTALLTANSTQFEGTLQRANKSMNRAQASWNSDLNRASRSFNSFDTHVRRSIGSIGDLKTQIGGIAAGVASALSIQKIIQYSDMWKQTASRLSLVTDNAEKLAKAQAELFKISQNNSTPINDTADAYIKLSMATSDAQKQQYDMLRITDLLAKTLKVSGTNAAGSAIFLQQFGQAASNDFKAIGQELQTFADQNPVFFKILRDEAAKSGQSLKDFAKDGGLSFNFVAEALLNASGQIESQSSKIALTVSQALTQLDNAFMQFIGQSEAVQSGTSSLAFAISALADNFSILATAAGAVALVMGARFAQAILAGAAAMIAASARTAIFNYQLGLLAFGTRAAAAGMTAMLGATTALGSAIAFLGGPIGIAVIGTLGLMAAQTHAAGAAQREMNERLEEHRDAVQGFIFASKERRKEIEDATRQNIQNLKAELETVMLLYKAYQNKSFIGKFISNLRLPGTQGNGIAKIAGEGAALEKAIAELEKDLATMKDFKGGSVSGGGATGGGTGGESQAKKLKSIIDGLKEESEQLELQTRLYGQKEGAMERAQTALKVEQQLQAAGLRLSKEQQAQVDKYLESIEKQTELQKEQQKQQEKLEDAERNRQQALDQLGATFESAFEKAIADGEDLGDVLDSLANDIIRLLTRLTITEPLFNGLKDVFSSSGSGSGSGGGLFSFIGDLFGGSFASGIDYVPNDMYAKLHRGEAVVRSSELDDMRGGSGVTVVIQNNNGSQVSQSSRQGANGPELLVAIDQAVADNINNKGSRTNQALSAFNGRTLIRR